MCPSKLALPIVETDNAVLQEVIDEALGTRYVDELLMMIETVPDETGRLEAERDRLRKGLNNLVESIALLGINATTVGPKVKEREAELAKVEAKLRRPRPERPNADKVRAALLERAGEWREALRAEPKVARLVLRRVLGPLTLSGAERPAFGPREVSASPVSIEITSTGWFVKWDADVKPGILEGIVPTDLVASPTGRKPVPLADLRHVGSGVYWTSAPSAILAFTWNLLRHLRPGVYLSPVCAVCGPWCLSVAFCAICGPGVYL